MTRDLFISNWPAHPKLGDMMLLVIGVVGTSVAPWQLFFQQTYIVDKRITPRVWDRLPLAVAVGGALLVFGTAATSWRPTWPQCMLVASASAGTVAWWALTGSLWPYVLLQLGGFLTLVCLVLARHLRSAEGWWTVVLAYTAFRLFEYFDRAVFVLTGQLVSGHTLKHLASAIAAFALITVVIHLDKRDLNR
jgi:hypothetical protein